MTHLHRAGSDRYDTSNGAPSPIPSTSHQSPAMHSIAARLAGLRLPTRRAALVSAAAAAMMLSACTDDVVTNFETGALVRVERSDRAIELRNPGHEPLAYIVIEAEFAARANFAFCADPGPECRRLPARGSVTVPYAQIGGYEDGDREAIVHTWRVVPDGQGGHEVADLRSARVGL